MIKNQRYVSALMCCLGTGLLIFFPLGESPAGGVPGWEFYESPAMGFSIQYPAGWQISDERPDKGGLRVNFKSEDNTVWFTITRGAGIDFQEAIDAEKKISAKHSSSQERSLSLDGLPAVDISYVRYWQRAEQYVKTINLFQEQRGIWIVISIYNYSSSAEDRYSVILDEMLSSFLVTG